jgi:hypothetical protein
MRLAVLAAVLLALTVGVSIAHACSCVAPQSPREDLANADAAFYGTVAEREVLDEGSPGFTGDEYVRYTFAVQVDYKDNLPDELVLGSSVQGSACGFDLAVGESVGMLLDRDQGQWVGGACSIRPKAYLDAGVAALPDPAAVPPAVFLAAGPFGAPRVAGLDLEGRLVGFGRGAGSVTAISACPGGAAAIENVQNLEGPRDGLAIRDAGTLAQRATIFLGLRRSGAHYEFIARVQCLNAAGTLAAVFLADSGTRDARLVLLRGGRRETIWKGTASAAAFRGRRAWIDGPDGVRAVDVRTGEERLLPLSGRPLAVSPDGRTLAVAADGVLRFVDLATERVLGSRGGIPSELAWIDAGRVVVRRRGRTRIVDRRARVIAELPSTGAFTVREGQIALADAARLTRYDRDGVVVAQTGPLFTDAIAVLACVESGT